MFCNKLYESKIALQWSWLFLIITNGFLTNIFSNILLNSSVGKCLIRSSSSSSSWYTSPSSSLVLPTRSLCLCPPLYLSFLDFVVRIDAIRPILPSCKKILRPLSLTEIINNKSMKWERQRTKVIFQDITLCS